MEISCEGTARIQHRETGAVYEIASDELDWQAVGGDERQMGLEVHYEAEVDHPDLGQLKWDLWEYPVGVVNFRRTDVGGHEVETDFSYSLADQSPGIDEWFDYPTPDNPFAIYMDSYHHTGDLLASHGSQYGGYILNRMVFSHQVTALEAYLSDTLINGVMGDAALMQRLIEKDEELAKEKFTLAEISKDQTLVKRKVHEYLRSLMYHNLPKINAVYRIVFGIRILDLAKDRDALFNAIMLRHDCVHRNGFDKDGKELVEFTTIYVQDTADQIKDFVHNIESAINSLSNPEQI